MTDRIRLLVLGEPVGKARPRATAYMAQGRDGPRPKARVYTPAATEREEERVRETFRARHPRFVPWTGPIMLRFTAVFETPASFTVAQKVAAREGRLYATKAPDKDNIEKLICDALNGVAWVDDAQLQGGGVKRYGSPARLEIELQRLDGPDFVPTPGDRKRQRRVAQPDLLRPLERPRRPRT